MENKYMEFKKDYKELNEKFGLIGDITLFNHVLTTIENDYKTKMTNEMFDYIRILVRDDITFDYESSYHNIVKQTVEHFELE